MTPNDTHHPQAGDVRFTDDDRLEQFLRDLPNAGFDGEAPVPRPTAGVVRARFASEH